MKKIFWFFLLTLIVIRYLTSQPTYKDGQKIRISALVLSEPTQYENSQGLKLAGLRMYLPKYPEVYYGDFVVVEGEVAEGELKNPQLKERKVGEGALYEFRKRIIAFFRKNMPEPHSSLIAGITIGSKSGLPGDFWEDLKKTGLAHVVVASGMNVSLVAGFLMAVFVVFFSRRTAVILALIGIWIYSILSGFDAPIVRAAIMGSLVFTAQKLGRLYDAQNALFLSALTMLILWPSWVSDLGFWLSFAATGTLLFFQKRILARLQRVPSVIRENLATTLAAQIGATPIIFFAFGEISLISPLTNILVLWTIPFVTILGMAGGLIGIIFEPFGKLILWLTYPLTSWFIFIVQIFGRT